MFCVPKRAVEFLEFLKFYDIFQITLDNSFLDYQGNRFRFKKDFSDVNQSSCLLTSSPYVEIKPLLKVTLEDIDCRSELFRKLWIGFLVCSALLGSIGKSHDFIKSLSSELSELMSFVIS